MLLQFVHITPVFADAISFRQLPHGSNIVDINPNFNRDRSEFLRDAESLASVNDYTTVTSLSSQLLKTNKPTIIHKRKSLSVETTWQLQLQGKLNTSYPADVYDIDLFDTPLETIDRLKALGKTVICYFSAGSFENWRSDAKRFSNSSKGLALDSWPGERWLDIRASNVRKIIVSRLNLAKQKGCDGVDPDNVDGYTNHTGFNLTAADQLAFNRFIAQQAHTRNMLVGLKNDMDQIPELVDDFDFSVNEQCHEYQECQNLKLFIDKRKPVFNVEYASRYVNKPDEQKKLCDAAVSRKFQTLILPLKLDDSFRISCHLNPASARTHRALAGFRCQPKP